MDERRLARPEGVEPPAYRFEACRSIQLSYGRARTHSTASQRPSTPRCRAARAARGQTGFSVHPPFISTRPRCGRRCRRTDRARRGSSAAPQPAASRTRCPRGRRLFSRRRPAVGEHHAALEGPQPIVDVVRLQAERMAGSPPARARGSRRTCALRASAAASRSAPRGRVVDRALLARERAAGGIVRVTSAEQPSTSAPRSVSSRPPRAIGSSLVS